MAKNTGYIGIPVTRAAFCEQQDSGSPWEQSDSVWGLGIPGQTDTSHHDPTVRVHMHTRTDTHTFQAC